uniref:Osteoclast-stimulating factor 1 n=1 Tax=Gouania willdenowi TaxID=441366 RepID=A0A8C5DBB6_GOUWI
MELWRQCAMWLIDCRVLPENHRVTGDCAQVCDLAQALRDGVLLCHLLNNLLPQAVNLREINLRPQMSQFLCLKNIRTFLGVCHEKFNLKKSEMFEAFDLFDVRDFAKVLFNHFYVKGQWNSLTVHNEEDDLYDCVEDEENEGDEIYEDLMRQQKVGVDKRECCLQEVRQTEEKYFNTLESILQVRPSLQDTHHQFLGEVQTSILNYGGHTIHQVFLNYKERLLLYGRYCSEVEMATKHLDKLSSMREDVKMKLEECSKRANSGRFSLRDLLMVPMQRVLKYPLLLQELMKHTSDPTEKENLRKALDAMRDLAQCVNEVKRDNEIIKQITTFQMSIENLTQSLALYGRPKIDGELKVSISEKKSKQDRYAFLFDKAVIICKKKSGESFELKEIIELQHYEIRDETTGEKDNKKWSHLFLLMDCCGSCVYELFFKTKELKRKWLEQFHMALSNMCPENATANYHEFQMHCFEENTSCKACVMLLRGIFFQGYRCVRCKMAAHKECLGRLPPCFPKMEVFQTYNGLPPPPAGFGQPLQLSRGDVIELTRANVDLSWWEVKLPCTVHSAFRGIRKDSMIQFYQKNSLKEYFKDMDTTLHMPFKAAEQSNLLNNHPNSTTGRQHSHHPHCLGILKPTMRGFGVVKARYDFSARDRSELSLREGDTIKILSKKGHSGWWKGEVYGRVGFFPANYVEDDSSDTS